MLLTLPTADRAQPRAMMMAEGPPLLVTMERPEALSLEVHMCQGEEVERLVVNRADRATRGTSKVQEYQEVAVTLAEVLHLALVPLWDMGNTLVFLVTKPDHLMGLCLQDLLPEPLLHLNQWWKVLGMPLLSLMNIREALLYLLFSSL